MWRTLLITVLCYASAFCYTINFNGKEIDINSALVFKEPMRPDSIEEDVEVEHIYYRTNLKSDVPYEDQDDSDRKYQYSKEDSSEEEEDPAFQPWSILWYIGSFGGLIAFFLVVSCSEWCCRSRGRRRDSENSTYSSPTPSEVPPPAYDLFAPPSYESLCTTNGEKSDYEVFVVPVDAMETLTENRVLQMDEPTAPPPAYFAESTNVRRDAPNEVVLNVARAEEQHRDSLKGDNAQT